MTDGYRVRMEFSDGRQVVLGPASDSIAVAVRPPTFWRTIWIFLNPGLRAGESFVRGDWTIADGDLATFLKITQVRRKGLYVRLYQRVADFRGPLFYLRQHLLPRWRQRAPSEHYEEGNELYTRMLDSSEQYSCAFFSLSSDQNLEAAQQVKLTVSIERLRLSTGRLRVLDIGCGCGALAAEIAKLPNSHNVTAITLSRGQLDRALIRRSILDTSVQQRLNYSLVDYRTFLGRHNVSFDRIISVGMFEHVGPHRHADFFRSVEGGLRPGGRALIHSIVKPSPGAYNEWMRRHIFPGSFLPSVAELIGAAEKSGLIVDAVHIHPPSDYRKTIQAWRKRLDGAWPELQRNDPEKFDARSERKWTFYLAGVETIFTEDLMNCRIAQVELRKLDGSINLAE